MIELINGLAWPIVTLIIILIFRDSLKSILSRIKGFEGPGDFRINLNETEVKQIIEDGNQNKEDSGKIAKRIMSIIDKRETRILRALLDDPGRRIYNYRSEFYKEALNSLIAKGYVKKYNKGFALSDEGFEFTKLYIQSVIND